MSRVKFALLALLLAVGFATAGGWIVHRALAGDPAKESVPRAANRANGLNAEAEPIEGTWAIVSSEGRKLAPEEQKDKWRFTADMILTRKDELGYKLNRGKKPYEIDILDEKKVAYVGIVEIQGGTMKMCLHEPPDRPAEFTAPADSGKLLIVFKREGKPDGAEKLRSLLKERFKTAGEEFVARNQQFLAGQGTDEILYQSARRLLQAEREMPDKSVVTALANHFRRMTEIEKVSKTRFEAGRIAVQDYRAAQCWRLEAEIWLESALQQRNK